MKPVIHYNMLSNICWLIGRFTSCLSSFPHKYYVNYKFCNYNPIKLKGDELLFAIIISSGWRTIDWCSYLSNYSYISFKGGPSVSSAWPIVMNLISTDTHLWESMCQFLLYRYYNSRDKHWYETYIKIVLNIELQVAGTEHRTKEVPCCRSQCYVDVITTVILHKQTPGTIHYSSLPSVTAQIN